ncbi:hypothetical protein GM921_07845 [Pedobacter sp. LMG 31464]|uniref:Lipoprotein n=1 Tax=Pedobacter planticolens TaxID=2679964 RepID=A0A923DYH5_9SPHI|nr:hypothetical protein [Pedobacter planticolens]MBB2145391.1 hypothetical protein [Pedobacter planticolens]
MKQQKIKRAINIIILSITLLISACVTNKYIPIKKRIIEFDTLTLSDVLESEKRTGSKDITPNHLIGIGEGIYPNKHKFILNTPRTFKIKELPSLELETEYFYTKNDSSVKVILYQWDYLKNEELENQKRDRLTEKVEVFQDKFHKLRKELTNELGLPVHNNIEQNNISSGTFRDGIKWKSSNGLNAYLFMFGNNNGYRQIRLAIYKE